MSTPRPNPVQFVQYVLGRPLPERYQPWVLRDVTGRGWWLRYLARGLTPLLPLYVAFLMFPGAVVYRLGMIMLLFLPFVYFMIALNQVYRRHLLGNNGLDPALATAHRDARVRRESEDYHARHKDPQSRA